MSLAYECNVEVMETDIKQSIASFMTNYSCETTPAAAQKIGSFQNLLAPGTSVFITFLPGSDFSDTIETAKNLKNQGFVPVPHIAARGVSNTNDLDERLNRLTGEAGVNEVLLIGGGYDTPIGEFADTMQLLETGLFDAHGINNINVAGHPEGSPDINDADILKALAWKNAFAQRTGAQIQIVTQFCFDAAPIIAWDKNIQAEGNKLPIRIGLPGLATIKTLIAYARSCGVGNSMRFLTRQARNVTRLLSISAPDKLVADLAVYKAENPACGIVSAHMFPLGGLKRTATWSNAVVDGRFTLDAKGGFRVEA